MVKKILNTLYFVWCAVWLISIYLVLFPFIFICIVIKPWNKWGTWFCNLWADLFFAIAFMPVKIEKKTQLNPKQNYIFVANHFSFLDIALGMKVVRQYFSYMGKASVKKIPLIGFMFARLHIQVDRSHKDSRAIAYQKSQAALKSGRSLFIMPEGGILSTNFPEMVQPFKDGAFSLAIESQVPIVPISFLNLYKILPSYFLKWGIPEIIVNEPISTIGKTKEDIETLKNQVYQIIQNQLNHYHENNP
ncbi:MAG: lysophospholipid acyltransferase family protein [Leadbetterella sp.]